MVLTQWSTILHVEAVTADAIAFTRSVAELAEKGGERCLDLIMGRTVILWAPADGNALSRFLAALLRRDPASCPSSLRLVAPLHRLPGMSSIENVTDVWAIPLLGDK